MDSSKECRFCVTDKLISVNEIKQEIYRRINNRIKWTQEANPWLLPLSEIEDAIDEVAAKSGKDYMNIQGENE